MIILLNRKQLQRKKIEPHQAAHAENFSDLLKMLTDFIGKLLNKSSLAQSYKLSCATSSHTYLLPAGGGSDTAAPAQCSLGALTPAKPSQSSATHILL